MEAVKTQVPQRGGSACREALSPPRATSSRASRLTPLGGAGVATLCVVSVGLLAGSVAAYKDLPPQSEWVCRLAEPGQRCADVYPNEGTKQKGAFCREPECCARLAVSNSGSFGDLCTSDAGQCRHRKEEFSYGKCNLKTQCHKCSPSSTCHYDDSDNGGVWCQCPANGKGNGITCDVDPCIGNPCNNGICSPKKDKPSEFQCNCYPGHTLVKDPLGRYQACVDVCRTGICGEGALHCLNGEAEHMCICKSGYINQSLNGYDTCVKPDLCAVQPCGKPNAVLECTTTSTTTYDCKCQTGFKKLQRNGNPYCAASA
ncbi:EGF family domain-containing protein [Besnoitia besnoiti]|uniref:EGF family domain-containing protein n=1 Tax=Besnoitia besnoiti TaxID=94643 RepID=A0A2A9MC34_BESBE|nr:EGF family domain-containing protein [Besnoitia besnoiti]PFH32952.1 EGF family domain-containing protein [Besnoitia besnoiti]